MLQWDKDDCAAVGLVKFDLLGLGMLTALHYAVDLVREHRRRRGRPGHHPAGGRGLRHALPGRLGRRVPGREPGPDGHAAPAAAPRRSTTSWSRWRSSAPGPIQGGSVHPYIRRRNGQEPVTYLHPLLEPSLEKTLGVPLFQEQLMQMAIDVAGFTPGEADQLRQAMGSKRSRERMERLRAAALRRAWPSGASPARSPTSICEKLAAFANYGFPESHSVSFAYLVYASSWLKLLLPGRVLRRAAQRPADGLLLAAHAGAGRPPPRRRGAHARPQRRRPPAPRSEPCAESRAPGGVRGAAGHRVGARRSATTWPTQIAAGRPYADLEDLARRVPALPLAAARGAGHRRRVRLLRARPARGAVGGGRGGPGRARTGWPASSPASTRRTLPGMSRRRGGRGRPVGHRRGARRPPHPVRARASSTALGVVTAAGAGGVEPTAAGCWWAAWSPTASGRPPPQGTTFLNLEDETGLINVVVLEGLLGPLPPGGPRRAGAARAGPARAVEGVTNVVAERIEPLPVAGAAPQPRLPLTALRRRATDERWATSRVLTSRSRPSPATRRSVGRASATP